MFPLHTGWDKSTVLLAFLVGTFAIFMQNKHKEGTQSRGVGLRTHTHEHKGTHIKNNHTQTQKSHAQNKGKLSRFYYVFCFIKVACNIKLFDGF